MMKVLLLGPDIRCKGGIASVLNNYLTYPDKGFIEFKFISVRGDNGFMLKLVQLIFGLIQMLCMFLFNRIQIIHAHPSEYNGFIRYVPYFLVAKMCRKRIILHMHGGSFESYFNTQAYVIKVMIREMLTSCNTIICLSLYWQKYYRGLGCEKVIILPNTVNQPEPNPYDLNSTNITYLGFIEEQKGIYVLLQAIRHLQECSDIHFHIYGSGEIENLNSKVVELGIKNRVTVHSWIDSFGRDRVLRDTSIFVLPSYFEALPMSLLESMAYGIPVISTNVGGIPDLIKSDNGILVTPGSVEPLSIAIENLYKNRELRLKMSAANYCKVKKSYTMATTFTNLQKIYKSII